MGLRSAGIGPDGNEERPLEQRRRSCGLYERGAAGGLEGASARAEEEVAARELPVISEGYTCSYSTKLKADGREAAAALIDVDDDEDLVQLEGRFEGKVLFENDAGQDKTLKVLAVQYNERTIRGKFQEYFEATIVQLERDESGGWSIPESSYADGEIRDCCG